MLIYGLNSCDTCRKARKALPEAEFVDVRKDGVSPAQLARFFKVFGEPLVNRRSTTWKGLSDAERATDPLELLAAHPTLMKRPVIEHEGALYLGWTADTQTKLLGNGE